MKRILTLLPLTLFLLPACGSDGAETPATDSTDTDSTDTDDAGIPNAHEIPDAGDEGEIMCAELGTYCHPFDENDGELGDVCHNIGHAGEPEACAEIYDECMALCNPGDAGADAGEHTEHADGGSAMCEELGHTCHDFDDGEGLGHECHEIGHAGDAHECAEVYDECMDLCSGDGGVHIEEDAGAAMCEELGHTCHDFDDGEGLGHECHEIGHAGDPQACATIYDECLDFCSGDAGAHDHEDAGD